MITEIGCSAFENCSALEKILIPKGTKKIGNDAFKGCVSLKDVTIPACLYSDKIKIDKNAKIKHE